MWRLTLYYRDQGTNDTGLFETIERFYKTLRGAHQAGRYYMDHNQNLYEYEIQRVQ